MSERRAMEPFEARFAERARAYTDVATERRIDPLEFSRTAMSSQRATGWSKGRLGAGLLGGRIAGFGWAAVVVAVVLIGVTATAVLRQRSDTNIAQPSTPVTTSTPSPAASAGGPVPDVLRHAWQRPPEVTPNQYPWGSGFLSLANVPMEFGPEPGPAASRSDVSAAGLDRLVVTATVETLGCATGDAGTYRWSVEGKDTVLNLMAIGIDACSAREKALTGSWVRSDLPANDEGSPLSSGTHLTSAFDPFAKPGMSGQLSYTVPDGWGVLEDRPAVVTLHHPPAASGSLASTEVFVFLLAEPRLASDFAAGASCGPFGVAPGVGHGVDDFTAAIAARPGVVSKPPVAVTIGGFNGQLLDLTLAPDWTRGCLAPEGTVAAVPILVGAGSEGGPSVGVGIDHPLRLILLDLKDGRTMSVAIGCGGPSQPSSFDSQVAEVMPIIESFEFHPPTP